MCPSTQTNTITVDQVTITSIDTTGVSCNGLADGTITINATGATQFSIDGGATFQTTNVFNVAAGTYTIVVQNANGCTASGTAVVTQPTPLAISVGIITPETCAGMCDGQIAALPSGGTVPYTVTWSGASTITGLTVTSACSGTYTATVTDGNGCIATGTVTMTSPATVTIISVTSNDPTCNAGTNGVITVVGSATVSQYSIDGGATFQATGSFTGLPAGTYPITVTDPAGCAATSTVTITEPTPVAVVASADVTICNGQSTTLTGTPSGGTPGYTIGWNDPTAATTASVVVTPTTTTTYTITVSDANGCGPVTDNVTVTVNPPLAVTASPDASICPGASTSISASASGGNGGPYTYTWSPSAGLSSSTGANVTTSPTTTTTYTVTVTDGCTSTSASDFVVVTVYTLPTVTYSVDNTQGCSPVVVNFTNTMASGTVSSSVWDFGNGTTGTGTTATGIFTASGCSDITLTVTTTDGCVVSTTTPNQICVYPNPVAEFSFAPQPTTVLNPEISFTNLSINGDSYNWNFAGLDSSTLANPSYVFPSETEGVYNVCLTVTTLQGCFDSICHNVEIMEEFLVYVPNAFTPDGDGINDIFLPQVMGEKPDSYELMIFNRWGELIFQSNNLNIGWDGTHKNVKSKEDTYVWKLKVKKRINEDKKEYVGHVNLLR
jgi:gliding motility-associated-like protein